MDGEQPIFGAGGRIVIRPASRAVVVAAALFCTTTAQAGVVIQADHLDVWHDRKEAVFTGHVHLTKDDFELFCDRLQSFYREKGGIERAVATGHVHMRQGEKSGRADRAVLDNKRQVLILSGRAVMEQPEGRISGATIIHHLETKRTEVEKGKSGQVRLRIEDGAVEKAAGTRK